MISSNMSLFVFLFRQRRLDISVNQPTYSQVFQFFVVFAVNIYLLVPTVDLKFGIGLEPRICLH